MIRKLVAAFVMILFAASLHSTALAFEPGKVIRVAGLGAPPKNFDPKDSYAKTFARQAAQLDALRQLVELIDGVDPKEESPGKIVTRISQDNKVFKLLEKNARVIDVKFLDGGGCAVDMELVFPTDWKIDIQPFPVPDWKND